MPLESLGSSEDRFTARSGSLDVATYDRCLPPTLSFFERKTAAADSVVVLREIYGGDSESRPV